MKNLITKDALDARINLAFSSLDQRGNQGVVFGIKLGSDISTVTVEVPVNIEGIEFAHMAGDQYQKMVMRLSAKYNHPYTEIYAAYRHNIEDDFTAKAVEGIYHAYACYWAS